MKPEPTAAKWEEQPLEWARTGGHGDLLRAALAHRLRRQRRWRIAGSGALVAVVAAGLAWQSVWLSPRYGAEVANSAAMASRAVVTVPERGTLADGSIVELKPGADIVVQFSAGPFGPRRIALRAGEAHFQVARDADRPFLVEAGGVTFRAVGTAFSVEVAEKSVEMIVTEGTVAVDRKPESPPATALAPPPETLATVTAGNRVRLDLAGLVGAPAVLPVTADEAGEKLAWRVPRLEFNETPLWEAVSLINQHAKSRISLAHPDLGRLEISGVLRADNVEPLLRMLEANYRIEVVRRTSGEIELKR